MSTVWDGLATITTSDHTTPVTVEEMIEQVRTMPFVPRGPDYIVVSPWLAENWERIQKRAQHESLLRIQQYHARRRRIKRWKLIARRQHRAAYRRKCRGIA